MNLKKKISILTQAAQKLNFEEWTTIDIILEQLGLPTQDEWQGSKSSYVMTMAKSASDEALTQLADYIGVDADPDTPAINPKFWSDHNFRIFISHLSSHQKFAGSIQDEFSKFGISCFVAHKDVEPTKEWQNEIESALLTCDALVALLHDGFHASRWTDQEIGFVMGRKKPAFTVRLGETPYGFIGRFQAFDGTKKTPKELVLDIFNALLTNKETSGPIALCLAKALEDSGSYARSVQLVDLLEQIEGANSQSVDLLKSALKNNSQVYGEGLHRVPERTKALIKKWS